MASGMVLKPGTPLVMAMSAVRRVVIQMDAQSLSAGSNCENGAVMNEWLLVMS